MKSPEMSKNAAVVLENIKLYQIHLHILVRKIQVDCGMNSAYLLLF